MAFTLAHVPYEFYQPWLRLLGEAGGTGAALAGGTRTPIVSGVVFALSMVGDTLDWPTLRGVLLVCALVGTVLALTVRRLGARNGADTGETAHVPRRLGEP